MQFPLGLSARLLRRKILPPFGSHHPSAAIFHLSPLVRHFPSSVRMESTNTETEWHTPEACVRAAAQAEAPAVWLGGTEPLFHPAIGEVASALAERGHYVFLYTSGIGLQKRIHEFKPVSRLYLTFEIPMAGEIQVDSVAEPRRLSPLQTVSEAIRIARLSGFFVCAHFTIATQTPALEVEARINSFRAQRVDGIVVSSGSVSSCQSNDSAAAGALDRVIQLVPVRGWRRFSRLLEASYSQNAVSPELSKGEAGACEETA